MNGYPPPTNSVGRGNHLRHHHKARGQGLSRARPRRKAPGLGPAKPRRKIRAPGLTDLPRLHKATVHGLVKLRRKVRDPGLDLVKPRRKVLAPDPTGRLRPLKAPDPRKGPFHRGVDGPRHGPTAKPTHRILTRAMRTSTSNSISTTSTKMSRKTVRYVRAASGGPVVSAGLCTPRL